MKPSSYQRLALFCGAQLLAVALGALGCSPTVGRESSNSAAYTLENGHRFVESVDGNKVVLKRKVDGAKLPFTDAQFVGKNLVIHPSNTGAYDGLFARVTAIEPAANRITLTVRALDLSELAEAAKDGDDTLTIYKNPYLAELPTRIGVANRPVDGGGGGVLPLSFDPLDLSFKPRANEGIELAEAGAVTGATWPPTIGSFLGLSSNLSGSVAATFEETEVSFTPGLSAKWLDGGIELGADMKLAAKFKVSFKGSATLATPVFETVEDQKLLVVAKGGPVTLFEAPVTIGGVYSTVGVKAAIACYARVEQKFSGVLDVDLGANLSGSVAMRMVKQTEGEPTFSEGSIPFAAGGHATANLEADLDSFTPSIFCEVPRVSIYVQPGGKISERLGGPTAFVALAGRFSAAWDNDPSFKAQAIVGLNAEPLGKKIGAETVLYTWVP